MKINNHNNWARTNVSGVNIFASYSQLKNWSTDCSF